MVTLFNAARTLGRRPRPIASGAARATMMVAGVFTLGLAGCGGSGGLFNLNPQPTGDIVLTNTTTGAALNTTLAKPFTVTGGAFSIGVTEDHFSGPYTVSVTAWTAPFNMSCFVPHYVDSTDKTNVVKFASDNATPVTAPTQPSPCNSFTGSNGLTQTDEETAQITDGKGHTTTLYYQIAGAAPAGGTGSGSASTPTKVALSWSGPSPTGNACGAYVLNVNAVNAQGASVATTSANPVTLSTTGGGYMGFSAATAGAGFTCAGSPPSGSPGGTPSLQLTTTPAQVLVYFNGYSASATTNVTASSIGTSPATLAIANAQTTTVASIKLAWNGAAPTAANCGAFSLNLQAFDSGGKLIVSSAYSNPITLSTNSALWSGFSTVTAGISPAPPPAAITCTATAQGEGTPTLAVPDTATPTVVYYDGLGAGGAPTTVTASAQGVAVQSITISF